jgi:Fe2+ or Zn2+ uptake regulation protein
MSQTSNQILKNTGLKITSSRMKILDLFSIDCKPINAEYIHQKLKKEKINLVTIYRTLASLELIGIFKKVDLQKDSFYYELAGHHHHHIICTSCEKIESFDVCDVDVISKGILKKSSMFKAIDRHSLELYAVCKTCLKN